MTEQVKRRSQETHKALTRHYAELGKRYANLETEGPSWTTSEATGSAAYVFVYLQVDCNLSFPGGPNLTFNGKGLVAGLGATGSLTGSATFNVDPNTLKGMQGVTFEAFGASVVGGGFQVTWYKDHAYIGHGEFAGLGVSLGTPGGGWGTFS